MGGGGLERSSIHGQQHNNTHQKEKKRHSTPNQPRPRLDVLTTHLAFSRFPSFLACFPQLEVGANASQAYPDVPGSVQSFHCVDPLLPFLPTTPPCHCPTNKHALLRLLALLSACGLVAGTPHSLDRLPRVRGCRRRTDRMWTWSCATPRTPRTPLPTPPHPPPHPLHTQDSQQHKDGAADENSTGRPGVLVPARLPPPPRPLHLQCRGLRAPFFFPQQQGIGAAR